MPFAIWINTHKTLSDKTKEKVYMNVGRCAATNDHTSMDKDEWNDYHHGLGPKKIKSLSNRDSFDGSVNFVYAQRVAERSEDKRNDTHSFMIEFSKQGDANMAINISVDVVYVQTSPQTSGSKTKRICTTLTLTTHSTPWVLRTTFNL